MKKLFRNTENKIIAGVCSGLGEYLNLDPVIVRLVWILAILCLGFGIIPYIAAWIIVPPKPGRQI